MPVTGPPGHSESTSKAERDATEVLLSGNENDPCVGSVVGRWFSVSVDSRAPRAASTRASPAAAQRQRLLRGSPEGSDPSAARDIMRGGAEGAVEVPWNHLGLWVDGPRPE